jgi:hypothetical protein
VVLGAKRPSAFMPHVPIKKAAKIGRRFYSHMLEAISQVAH